MISSRNLGEEGDGKFEEELEDGKFEETYEMCEIPKQQNHPDDEHVCFKDNVTGEVKVHTLSNNIYHGCFLPHVGAIDCPSE